MPDKVASDFNKLDLNGEKGGGRRELSLNSPVKSEGGGAKMYSQGDGAKNNRTTIGDSAADPRDSENMYGMNGLLNVVQMASQGTSMLTLGCDLTALGLNLNSRDTLYTNFGSPWTGTTTKMAESDFTVPYCYYLTSIQNFPANKVTQFADESLFYIFYTIPRDVLQQAAAVELKSRGWGYHMESRLWIIRAPGEDPINKTPTSEYGTYIYFDPTTWKKQKKELHLVYDQLADFYKKESVVINK